MFLLSASQKSTARDMTSGSIVRQIILFALPLMLGNAFQMLYNTVDSIVVGNFVGKQALAAVGSTTMIVNMIVFFFNGFSTGAGVSISRAFGARDLKKLHIAIETTMCTTFLLSIIFSVGGVAMVDTMLRFMDTPDDVFAEASVYLRIYIGGISGLLVYNMCSGILRAVGDSTRPLYFLILTSLLNIALDLVFVIVFQLGIAGVALATILSQFVSAGLTLLLLSATKDIYKLSWRDLRIDFSILKEIFAVGLPAGIQSIITAFSNIFVQSYINYFGSSIMAGWSCYNKLDQFLMLPMQSMAMAATTFVSQNIGAGQSRRANRGTVVSVGVTLAFTSIPAAILLTFPSAAVSLFSKDASVIEFGSLFLRSNILFMLINCVNHVTAGSLRGRGDSRGPMIVMLSNFVAVRQIYLYVVTHFYANTPFFVGISYPVGWTCCCISLLTYYYLRWGRKTVD